jgi:undecaprenyl-diphosphatase
VSLFYPPTDSSFPANSAGVAFSIATVVFFHHRKLGLLMYALAFMWGLARVFAGVHYPTDILGGAVIGVAFAFFSMGFVRVFSFVARFVLRIARLIYIA